MIDILTFSCEMGSLKLVWDNRTCRFKKYNLKVLLAEQAEPCKIICRTAQDTKRQAWRASSLEVYRALCGLDHMGKFIAFVKAQIKNLPSVLLEERGTKW